MYKNRLEEIKEIHQEANEAYNRFESSSACADQNVIGDSLNTLFYEEHTDWLIEQAEKLEEIREVFYADATNVVDGYRKIIEIFEGKEISIRRPRT